VPVSVRCRSSLFKQLGTHAFRVGNSLKEVRQFRLPHRNASTTNGQYHEPYCESDSLGTWIPTRQV